MKNLLIIAIAYLLIQCEPVVPQQSTVQKKVVFDDYDYETMVGNVRIAPVLNGNFNALENPIINLNENDQLVLTFDLLTDQFENLGAKIYHCNKDWDKSGLRDMEFLNEINNYRVTEFNYSVNTVYPYINYTLEVPKPYISGNYIIAVFRRANPNDLLLTRKFMVVNPIAGIDQILRVSTTIDKREKNHQIEFSISYGNLLVTAPSREISTTILQNHNWRTALRDIPPTLIKANEGVLDFMHLDLTTNFPGWNEFRFADLRTLNVTGRNVAKIDVSEFKIQAQLGLDRARGNRPYSQNLQDINGNFIIQNNDAGEVPLNADYANVQFNLKSEEVIGDVYITGRFNDWQLNDLNRMRYNKDAGVYYTNLRLKQGYYEYIYHVENSASDAYQLEGSHTLTENDYEILVYYRRPGNINDEIIGYKKFSSR